MALTLSPEDLVAITNIVNSSASTIAKAVWDEVLTGATHNINNSAGRRLRQLSAPYILDGTIVSSTTNSVTLDGGASTQNGAYDPALITIMSGSGIGQTRLIYQYDGATKTAYVDRDWKFMPAPGDDCVILSDAGREHVNEGLIRSASATAVQLNANASSSNDEYIGQVIFIRSGTGQDQARRIFGYTGSSKIATLGKAWTVTPDNTSCYVMLPTAVLDILALVDRVWNEDMTLHTTANTSGCMLIAGSSLSGSSVVNNTSVISAGNIASAVWGYARRTLGDANAVGDAPDYQIDAIRGDTFEYTVTDVDLTDYVKAYFTVKSEYKDTDAQSVIQVSSSSGLLYLNGASASSIATSGSIALDAVNEMITITVSASAMSQIPYDSANYYYDLQLITSASLVETYRSGVFSLVRDVTRAIT